MSVIRETNTNKTTRNTGKAPAPFKDCWINVGFVSSVEGEDGESTDRFVRLPLGIPVAALKPRRLFANMTPEYRAESEYLNQIIAAIQGKFDDLAPGESADINMSVQVYRAQEEEAPAESEAPDENAVSKALFG